MVLVSAAALVFAVGRVLGGGSGSQPVRSSWPITAAKSSVTPTPTPGVAGPQPLDPASTGKATQPGPTGSPVELAVPNGPCAIDEITVTPSVPAAVAGGRVEVQLELSGIRPACTFSVSSRTLATKITSGNDRIWSTQDCPNAIKPASIVIRSAEPTTVAVAWNGRRSDDDCSKTTAWALPGYYHVTASVIGSEPGDAQFRLGLPPRPVVTKTAKPKKQQQEQQVD